MYESYSIICGILLEYIDLFWLLLHNIVGKSNSSRQITTSKVKRPKHSFQVYTNLGQFVACYIQLFN